MRSLSLGGAYRYIHSQRYHHLISLRYKHLTSLRSHHDLDLEYTSLGLKNARLFILMDTHLSIVYSVASDVFSPLYQLFIRLNTRSNNFFISIITKTTLVTCMIVMPFPIKLHFM